MLLASIPALEAVIGMRDNVYYRDVTVSPDGSIYLYHAPLTGYVKPPYRVLFLGLTDGRVSLGFSGVCRGRGFFLVESMSIRAVSRP